VIDSTQPQAFN